jgi:hypothetical protein
MKHPIALAWLIYSCSLASAQTDSCITNLKNAGSNFEQGNYDQTIAILNTTVKDCDLSKQDQIEANKLLILAYLAIDNLEAADKTAAAIMKIDPTYKPDKFRDDPGLSALFEKYKPEPMLTVGISGGINWPSIHVGQTYSVVHADDDPDLGSYKSVIQYQLGAYAEYRLYRDLWLTPEIQFRKTSYEHTLNEVQGATIHYYENISYFEIPLSLKYYFLQGPLSPYVQAGADFCWMLQALSTTTREGESDLVDRTDLRTSYMTGFFGAAGLSYGFKGNRVFADFRYLYFHDPVNKDGTRYADEVNLYKYYYIDDDFRMDNLQFNIGFSHVLSYAIRKNQ